MTRLYNDPASFTEDMLAGFLDANAEYVAGVPGGVVRASPTRLGKVAVVVGGGSGHYPAFCGVVGPGFADGAVVGNIFTSPSATAAASVARAADGGAGVLLTTGNYAGDVMNFGLAVEQLNADGIPARYFAVTDDIASAPAEDSAKRRGIAGDFTVFKCASAAAEAGYDLDGVVRVAASANDNTRSLGVAFDGCTLPGAAGPLFTVEPGTMGLGLGIHGEPGVASHDMPTAAELAELLVSGVLKEKPVGAGARIAVILNGLGRTKYEELFVVWATAAELLRAEGYSVVQPEVGELVTSLDMAGCSLTVMWLDDELERFWTAPADTPAYRRGSVIETARAPRRSTVSAAAHDAVVAGDGARQPDGGVVSGDGARGPVDGVVSGDGARRPVDGVVSGDGARGPDGGVVSGDGARGLDGGVVSGDGARGPVDGVVSGDAVRRPVDGVVADDGARRLHDVATAGDAARRLDDVVVSGDAARRPDDAATADDAARRCGAAVAKALQAVASKMVEVEEELGRIDAIAGDGDHGRGMVRGTAAARAAADAAVARGAGHGGVLKAAGAAWAAEAGGTSGVLWGAALTAMGGSLGDIGRPTDTDIAAAMRAGYDALGRLGKAQPGDKTMLDALLPLLEAAERGESWHSAAAAAESAARATAGLRPKVGRARPLAERSIGSPDAGAISLAICARTVADTFVTEGAHR